MTANQKRDRDYHARGMGVSPMINQSIQRFRRIHGQDVRATLRTGFLFRIIHGLLEARFYPVGSRPLFILGADKSRKPIET